MTTELEHERRIYGATIRHDLANTRAVLTDASGGSVEFASTADEPNATLQAIRWAKAAKIAEPTRPVEQAEGDEPTDTESEGD